MPVPHVANIRVSTEISEHAQPYKEIPLYEDSEGIGPIMLSLCPLRQTIE